MKKFRNLTFFTALFLIYLSNIVYSKGIDPKAGTTAGSFLKIGIGARPIGMGESFCAVAEDVNTLYWNPAGIVQLENKEIIFMYNRWLEEINYGYLGFVYPFGKRAVGISIAYLDAGKIQGYDKDNNPTSDVKASDLLISGSYSQKLNDKLLIGITAKIIQERLENERATAYAVDAGILYRFLDNLSFAGVVQNIGITGIKFVKESQDLPMNIKIGTAYKISNLLLSIDLNKPSDRNYSTNFGGEYWIQKMIALRIGYKTVNTKDVNGNLYGFSTGLGIRYSSFQLDSAFLPYGELGSSFQVSFSVKF